MTLRSHHKQLEQTIYVTFHGFFLIYQHKKVILLPTLQ
jgi:hypothetical protein